MKTKLKVAILHDWLTGFRGGERVLEAICELFPDAPLYTLIYKKGSTSDIIENRKIHTSFLNKIPGIYSNYRKFLPLMPLAASLMKIKGDYDLIISSSHCVIKGVKKPKEAKHLCYIHSPMRYIYDQFENYFGNSSLPVKIIAHLIRPYLKYWDKKSNNNVDLFLPNSKFVLERMQKCYGNNFKAQIVNPFVDLEDISNRLKNINIQKQDYYLMVSAFAPNKRIDMAIEAFNELGFKLKIIGTGSDSEIKKLKEMAKSNIDFLGSLSRDEVIKYMANAKAFIFPGVEDFGITPLESLAVGTKVIAFKAGGVLETLNEDCATFFNEANKKFLIEAILKDEVKKTNNIISRAEIYSKNKFMENISNYINSLITHR